MSLDFSQSRLKPFIHQQEDAERVYTSPYLFITSEMRTGKTKIVIDGAQHLFHAGKIDRVLVLAPAPVRRVWYDPYLGELRKHLWTTTPSQITEYHASLRTWTWIKQATTRMQWLITNFEFIRSVPRRDELMHWVNRRTLLVVDESSFVKNWTSLQTKSTRKIRNLSGRVILMNGTPITHSPMDLFAQGNLLHPSILDCKYITLYKSRYAVQAPVLGKGGKPLINPYGDKIETVVDWPTEGLEDLQKRFAPVTIRRLQKDCLDLPPKLDPVVLQAELTNDTWKKYKAMRDELVLWLTTNTVATAAQAAVKSLRLAQITSGFVGGVESAVADMNDMPLWMMEDVGHSEPVEQIVTNESYRYLGTEKLEVLSWFLDKRLREDPNLHIVVWCRFRPEVKRMMQWVQDKFPQFTLGTIIGGQKRDERERAMQLLDPRSAPKDPVLVGGTFGTGAFGLNFTAASTSINLSFDYNLGKYLQSADRVYGPGQISPVAYYDVVASGPNGQRTIDHAIVEARQNNENIANWTVGAWVNAIRREE